MTRLLAVLVVLVGLSGLVGCKTQVAVTPKPCAEEAATEAAVAEKPAPEPDKATVAPVPPAPKPTVEAPKPEPPAPKPAPAPVETKPEPKPAPKAEDKPAEAKPEAPAPEAEDKPAEAKPEAPAPKAEDKPAEAKPEAPAPKAEDKPAEAEPEAEPPKPLGDVDAKTWEVPGSAEAASWAVTDWSNPATLSSEDVGVKIEYQGGEAGKATVALRLNADLSSRTSLLLDVDSRSKVAAKLAAAVMTTKAKYFEGPPETINPGPRKDVRFDLTSAKYKTGPSWQHDQKIVDINKTTSICLVICGEEPGAIVFSNVRLLAEE